MTLHFGIVTNSFYVYTNELKVIAEGTKVCLQCTNTFIGEWKVGTSDDHWTMAHDRIIRNIKIVELKSCQ